MRTLVTHFLLEYLPVITEQYWSHILLSVEQLEQLLLLNFS